MFLPPAMTSHMMLQQGVDETEGFGSGSGCLPNGGVPGEGDNPSKWATETEIESLYSDSFLNIDPESAFYLNEFFSIFIMSASTAYYLILQRGQHDYFQWVMHLSLWGQTNLFWLLSFLIDSEASRNNYFVSSFLTSFIPYIGIPIYIFWLGIFHLDSNDGTYSFNYVMGNVGASLVYMALMRFYGSNMLTSLNNYALILTTERL